MSREHVFLTAEWRNLIMLSYEVDPKLLEGHVPRGTKLDDFGGRILISLVGFQFLRTRIFGAVPIPFHTNFDEVNLRFYVRRRDASGEMRRGVVFIREIVPRRVIALVARLAYHENYHRYPMQHRVNADREGVCAEYRWQVGRQWLGLQATAAGEPTMPTDGSMEQFLSEHYWGYSRQRNGETVEYRVNHPQWRVWPEATGAFEGDGAAVYGADWGRVLGSRSDSAFVSVGSAVTVFGGKRIS